MKTTAWMSRKLDGDRVECLACSHYCKIKPGHHGICGVRINEGGELKLLVYGRPVAQHVDPMEKKPLYHFHPGMPIFSIGTVGCNFRCEFCQNADISQFHREHDEKEIEHSGFDLPPEEIIRYCREHDIRSVAYTYNEPAIFFEYAYDTARLAKEAGILNVYVSNGFETREALEKILPYLDAINIDLKSFRDDFYRRICGGDIDPVKENIRLLWEKGVWVEVTTLLIPGRNDTEEELTAIAEFLVDISPDLPWHVSRFHPCYRMLDVLPTPVESLERAYAIGEKAGLRYIYLGNILHKKGENTYCPHCKSVVIQRSGYLVQNRLAGDRCPHCNTVIAGRFDTTEKASSS